jgi:hypothetical protein
MSLVKGFANSLDVTEQTTLTVLVNDLPAAGVDLAGCAGAAFLIMITGGTQGTSALSFYEGSTTTPTSDIAVADLSFNSATFSGTSPQALNHVGAADAGTHIVGYHGSERYIRIEIDTAAGTPDAEISTSVIRMPLRRAGNTP